jgi:glycogen phosphorylase
MAQVTPLQPLPGSTPANVPEAPRLRNDPVHMQRSFLAHVSYTRAKGWGTATALDRYMAIATAVRDRLTERWVATQRTYHDRDVKRVCYLSAEYLLGRALGNNLIALGMMDAAREALSELGVSLSDLLEVEADAGLGNGGLGRLAACFLDSMATLGYPGVGYGIRYEFGIFTQDIVNGHQVERADEWLKFGNPWEFVRPELSVPVRLYGRVEHGTRPDGSPIARWVDGKTVLGIPYDTPIAGYATNTVNTLRLWQARASDEFDFRLFNAGDYERSVVEKNDSETISKVLYPNDNFQAGKELRLKQEYFFVACSLADIIRRFLKKPRDLRDLPRFVAIQLNDTHPAVAVPELLRILVDEQGLAPETAWDITVKVMGYTNHTLLAEALEVWPVGLFERLLPRHLEIIYEINQRFLRAVQIKHPFDMDRQSRMSLIEEGVEKKVRMANLAVVGSHSVNGVAALHTELLKRNVMPDFAEMFPEKFNNKTNGVTPRRWLLLCNPRLAELVTSRIGPAWVTDLDQLRALEPLATETQFGDDFRRVKLENKKALAAHVQEDMGVTLDTTAIFDVQVKRLHEYKRQLLNALHVVWLWMRARENPASVLHPRAFLFGAKAAPGYQLAKSTIRLINGIGEVVNADANRTGIQVVFLPNYRVSLAERIIPAADVSEQISTAGKEASGTGNMKFALNGALTLGTLDGANIEIREAVGAENFFLFGLTADEVEATLARGYRPRQLVEQDPELKAVLELVASGFFSPEDRSAFRPLVDALLNEDRFLVLADFRAYVEAQHRVAQAYLKTTDWTRMAVLNVARVGFFSSDRTIREYARDIWGIHPVEVKL